MLLQTRQPKYILFSTLDRTEERKILKPNSLVEVSSQEKRTPKSCEYVGTKSAGRPSYAY